jgi:nucleotide-binding universal stress UspA family protein
MYKHILVPTDGSKLAAKGVRAGVKFAAALGAKVTGLFVIPPYVQPMYDEGVAYSAGYSRADYRRISEAQAKKALAVVEIEAQMARIRCSTRFVTGGQPWGAILKAARAARCDAIVMASHGRGGLGGLLLGSETTRVLANSKIPVLVIR